MTDFDPQPSESPVSQPPDASSDSRRTDRASEGYAGGEPPRKRRDMMGQSAAQPSGEAGTDRTERASQTRPRSTEDLFVLVSDRRRRQLLSVLCTVQGEITVSRLASEIEARSGGSDAAGQRRAIEISLVHDHLPRLASMDLITYDRDRRRVRTTPVFGRMESRIRSLIVAGDRVADE